MSLGIFIIILSYGIARGITFATRDDDSVTIYDKTNVLDHEKEYNFANIGQVAAFGMRVYHSAGGFFLLDHKYFDYHVTIN